MKKLGMLRGIAVVAVVMNHAAGYGMFAIAFWGARFGAAPTTLPSQWIGSASYYTLLGLSQFALFSVPLFLFASGFFVTYASRGNPANLTRPVILGWLKGLLLPFGVWFVISTLFDFMTSATTDQATRLDALLAAARSNADYYYYVPLVVVMLVASPVLVRVARRAPLPAIALTGGFLFVLIARPVLEVLGVPHLETLDFLTAWNGFIFSGWKILFMAALTYFFLLGLVIADCPFVIRDQLARRRRWLAVAALGWGVLSVIEADAVFRRGTNSWNATEFGISTFIYATLAIFAFLAWDWRWKSLTRRLERLGTMSYGVYLAQPVAIAIVVKAVYHAAPQVLPEVLIFQPLLIAAGVGIPLLLMAWFKRLPARQYHRMIFG